MVFTCNLRTQEVEAEGTLCSETSWGTVTRSQANQSPHLKQTNEQTSKQPTETKQNSVFPDGSVWPEVIWFFSRSPWVRRWPGKSLSGGCPESSDSCSCLVALCLCGVSFLGVRLPLLIESFHGEEVPAPLKTLGKISSFWVLCSHPPYLKRCG